MPETRRNFVAATAAMAAAALAADGGPPAVTMPAATHNALTRWPRYGADEKKALIELIDSNRFYQEIALLEQETRAHTGAAFAKAHCNGTSALMSAFFAMDLPPGSEVLTPSYTASASIVPMRFFGLVPVFVDIDPRTACFDLNHAARVITSATKAVVPMHAWGLPCDLDEITAFAGKHGLIVLEDAAQAEGASLHGRPVGTWGEMGVFSYQMSKVLPAVEGGMGLYKSREHYERATAFGNYDLPAGFPADSAYRKYHDTGFGPKFRIHPMAAALARRQLTGLNERNALVAKQVRALNDRITQLPGLSDQRRRTGMQRVHWASNILFFDEAKAGFSKAALLAALQAEGVRASAAPYPEQHQFAIYREAKWWHHAPRVPDVLPGCAQVNKSAIRVPLFTEEASELIEQYARAFEKVWAHGGKLAKTGV
jgi:dTDP-4-amino-4,6-dideoxygalactose transaminase